MLIAHDLSENRAHFSRSALVRLRPNSVNSGGHCTRRPQSDTVLMSDDNAIAAYGNSWYAATKIDAPVRPPLSSRPRRRCLRHRRRARGTDGRARSGEERLVGRAAGSRPPRRAVHRAAIPASCCRASAPTRTNWWRGSASSAPRIFGRCRRPASIMCGRHRCRRRRLRHRSAERLAACLQARQ